MRKFIVTALTLAAMFVTSCSQVENKSVTAKQTPAPTQTTATAASPTTTPLVSSSPLQPASGLRNLPPEGGDKPTKAKVGGYAYSYKKDGEKTVATFGPKLLPWDKDLVAVAIRDVIDRSYGEKVDSAPRIEGTGPELSIRVTGSKHQYVVVPTGEPTGEIHSLIITRLD